MGTLMREYWLPALLSSEVRTADSDPLRVKLLGEDLIAFRDTFGKMGLVQNLCPHRGASLFFGRNEQGGLRCVYHGWKFDVTGKCVDMPNEPPESNFKDRVRARSYPCEERDDVVFVYMGPREVPPPLPRIEALEVSQGSSATARMTPANWLQVMEGAIDTVHAAFLHRGASEPEWFPEGSFEYYGLKQRWATLVSAETEDGAIYGAHRPGPEGSNYWRIGKFMFPFWATPGAGYMGWTVGDTAYVPMDDSHTMVFNISAKGPRIRSGGDRRPKPEEMPTELELLPNTTDWFGRFRAIYDEENDFLVNREQQRSLWSFAGMPYRTANEDMAVQVTMGPTLPREIENLGRSDAMIVRVRQRLLEAALAFAKHEAPPPAVDTPEAYLGRVGQVIIPEDADWLEHTAELRRPFVDNGAPDPLLSAGPGPASNGTRYMRHTRSPLF
jgi:nitrite reductase/ring-hydroxylating ferredoxin subunit